MAYFNDIDTPTSLNTDADAISDAIYNILMTPKGTLPGKPLFGSRIHELLFNQIDDMTISLLKSIIKEAIQDWEFRINITDIDVTVDEAHNRLEAVIYYAYTFANKTTTGESAVTFAY